MEQQSGRKYKLALVSIALLTLGFVASGFQVSLQEVFPEFAMGLSGLLGLYCGGNVGNKLVTKGKTHKQEIISQGG